MKNKIIITTIPMLKPEDLKKLKYRRDDDGIFFSNAASFPSIPLIEWNVDSSDSINIVTVSTDDDNGRTKENMKLFEKELKTLSDEMGFKYTIQENVVVPHSENMEKQYNFFKMLSGIYTENSEIYMDLTYGTKPTSIGLFSTLVYAENIKNCDVKSIIYGKYSHNDSDFGNVYELLPLYEMNMIINSASHIGADKMNELLDNLWGK